MKQEIIRIAPLQAAKVFALLYLVLGVAAMPLFALPIFFAGSQQPPAGIGLVLAMPVVYAIVGFVGAALACALYNLIASQLGGIELDLVDPP